MEASSQPEKLAGESEFDATSATTISRIELWSFYLYYVVSSKVEVCANKQPVGH